MIDDEFEYEAGGRRAQTGLSTSQRLALRGGFVASVLALVLCAGFARTSTLAALGFIASAGLVLGFAIEAWRSKRISARELLLFALIARLVALPLLPTLSDDGYRYIWDGWLQLEGISPFEYRPSAEELSEYHKSELFSLLNSPDYYSVYPPSSQLFFLLGGAVFGIGWEASWYTIKVLFIFLEGLALWLASRSIPSWALVLYAWHPLVIIEGAGQGHTEIAMAAMLIVALCLYKTYPAVSTIALTVAAWFKLYPLIFIPLMLRTIGWRHIAAVLLTSSLLLFPYARPEIISNYTESLGLYVQSFEFNAGLYYALKAIVQSLTGSDPSKTLGPVLALAGAVVIGTIVVIHWNRRVSIHWAWILIMGAMWLTATTIHPWYLIGVLAVIPFVLQAQPTTATRFHVCGWLWLSFFSLATYLLYSTGEAAYTIAVAGGWSGWFLWMIAAGASALLPHLMRYRGLKKWNWVAQYLDTKDSVLDLGAGEGYVGEAAARQSGHPVILSDVIDLNQTELEHVVYDGHSLPFARASFDVVLLVFVLHHCKNPETVLSEARRVSAHRLAVIESVTETTIDRAWLPFADRLANRIRSQGAMNDQEEHLTFRSAAQWKQTFEAIGLRVVAEERRGRWLHKQHLFILEPAAN